MTVEAAALAAPLEGLSSLSAWATHLRQASDEPADRPLGPNSTGTST